VVSSQDAKKDIEEFKQQMQSDLKKLAMAL